MSKGTYFEQAELELKGVHRQLVGEIFCTLKQGLKTECLRVVLTTRIMTSGEGLATHRWQERSQP